MKILVSALEHSANVHLKSILEHTNNLELCGVFDSTLGNPIIDMQKESIMGFSDAVKKLPFFFKLASTMVELAKDCDKILLIDSSGFNLPLAKKIKKKYPNKEIIYYILPQAWAWKKGRIATLSSKIDNLLSILPFEPSYYPKEANIKYVGHPLLDQIKEYKETINTNPKSILFMPGSRKGEIKRLMPIFLDLSKELKDKELILAVPKHLKDKLEIYGDIKNFRVTYNSTKALKEADFAFICSGTATLEASIIGTPFILAYKAKALDYFIGKKLIKLNYIGLANIFFEHMGKEPMHKEFIQEEASANNLLNEFNNFNYTKYLDNSKVLKEYLNSGSAKEVAKVIES
jgi:lipid-A-disaccharide synthase